MAAECALLGFFILKTYSRNDILDSPWDGQVSLERSDSRLPPRLEAVAPASPEPVAAPDLARALRADEGEVQLAIDGPTAD
jgi:hypothetical protein